MSAPSFLYSGIDKETLSLSDELNSMGGGDAQASHLEMHAIVNTNLNKNDIQLLWPYDHMLGLRDVSLPVGTPASKSMKYFQMDSVTTHDGFPAQRQEFADIALDSSQWVTEGFNSCIFSMGMRGSGKTTAMFGLFGVSSDGNTTPPCLAGNVLESLFERKKSAQNRQEGLTTIALSAWSVVQDRITDLIAPVATDREPLDFASVECPDLSTACRILHEARARAPGCLVDAGADAAHERHRGHFFLRILLHRKHLNDHSQDSDEGSISYMYLVDLLGLATTDTTQFGRLGEEQRIATRANNLTLQCLFKILAEMRTLSAAAASNPLQPAEAALTSVHAQRGHTSNNNNNHNGNASIMKMTSARDSKLTTILAPIIQGNVKSSLLLFLQDGASYASETQNLLNSVNGVTEILSACMRIKSISLRSLGLIQRDQVLPPYIDPTRRTQTHTHTHTHTHTVPVPVSMFVPAPYSPERDHKNFPMGSSVYMPSPDLPYTYSPARHTPAQNQAQAQQQQQQHHSQHTAQHSTGAGIGASSASVLTDTSTDYGEMDFERILAGDFHHSPQGLKRRAHQSPKHHDLHPHYQQADLQRVAHPPSGFEDHRRAHYHAEAHPSSGSVRIAEALHPHIRESDIRRVEHAPSEEFLEHRKSHYHAEAHPPASSLPSDHHATIREADARRVEHAPSQEFIEHRRAFNHSELHPTGNTADGHYVEEHHAHFQPQDVRRVGHAPSEEFLEHRRAFNHSELHPTGNTADGHYSEVHHAHFNGQDVRRVEHPPSQEFLTHRKSHYHSEAHPGSSSGGHSTGPVAPEFNPFSNPRGLVSNHLQSQGPQMQGQFEDESPVRGPRTHPEVVSVLDEFHDLMEELENDHQTEQRDKQHHYQQRQHQTSSPDPQNVSTASSMGFPRQIVQDFLQHNRLQGGGSPPRNTSSSSSAARHQHSPPSATRTSRSVSPQRSPARQSREDRAGRESPEHRGPSRSRSPSAERKHRKSSPERKRSERRDVSSIGPGQAQYGADESFFSHFQFPVEISPKRSAARSGKKSSARKSKASAVDSSMMADSLFAGSEFDASFDGSPTMDDNFNETSPPRGYKYRYGSARTSVESSGTRIGEVAGIGGGGGIGGSTAAPVGLRGPRLADTNPADLETVNHIASSYAEFFQDSLLAADPLNRLDRLGRLVEGADSDGPEEYIYTTSSGDAEVSFSDPSQDLDNTVDSLDLEDVSTHKSSQNSPTRKPPQKSNSSPSHRSNDGDARMPASYVPYVDAAIPEGSMTLPEALLELEHLRRTNHALVESLSEESHRRSELDEKLSGAQDDLLEVRTQCDVQLDNYKLEVKQLKAQMRTICDNQSLTDVFATFEDNVARLVRENEALREANLRLEAKELDSLLRTGANGASSDVNALENHTAETSGESFRLQTAKKENLRLVTKLKKSGIEREALKSAFEEVKAKERQFVVNTKIANDCARRLRVTHQELLRTKKELEQEQSLRAVAERDLHLIREDTAGLRVSEAVLKEERARNLSELAMLRERVREVDHERRRLSQMHRFVEKHYEPVYAVPQHQQPAQQSPPRRGANQSAFHAPPPPPPAAVPSILKAAPALSTLSSQPYRQRIVAALSQHAREPVSGVVPPYSMPSAVPYGSHSDEHKGSYDEFEAMHLQSRAVARSEGTVGQAGLSDAQYLRLEESDGIEPALEVSLTAMHESLIATTPQLLPLFRRLTTDIHSERTKALQKRSQLLNQLGAAQYDRPTATTAATTASGANSNNNMSTKDSNAAYLNMLKSRGLGNGNSYVTQHEGKVGHTGAKKSGKSVRF